MVGALVLGFELIVVFGVLFYVRTFCLIVLLIFNVFVVVVWSFTGISFLVTFLGLVGMIFVLFRIMVGFLCVMRRF